jgi:hypothetical protein
MDIEAVAANTPEKIHTIFIDPVTGLTDAQADGVARKIGVPDGSVAQARSVLQGLYRAFHDTDASLAEINPLVVTGDGSVIALDAKLNFDSNALFRHPEIVEMRDLDEEDPPRLPRRSSTCRTFRSTATSAVWSTAPASRWRRWIRSSSTAASPRTFSTSAAARPRRRSPRRSK